MWWETIEGNVVAIEALGGEILATVARRDVAGIFELVGDGAGPGPGRAGGLGEVKALVGHLNGRKDVLDEISSTLGGLERKGVRARADAAGADLGSIPIGS